jgi:hypothetical protein
LKYNWVRAQGFAFQISSQLMLMLLVCRPYPEEQLFRRWGNSQWQEEDLMNQNFLLKLIALESYV